MKIFEYMKSQRTTSHFRDMAIAEVKVAYRLKEYLDPDGYFPSKDLNNATKVLLEAGEYREAIERIIDKELGLDIGDSSSYEKLVENATQFARFFKDKTWDSIVSIVLNTPGLDVKLDKDENGRDKLVGKFKCNENYTGSITISPCENNKVGQIWMSLIREPLFYNDLNSFLKRWEKITSFLEENKENDMDLEDR